MKIKLVVSDLHLGEGDKTFDTNNPHESFFFDRQFVEFLSYYSSQVKQDDEIEIIINGDFIDYLAIPTLGKFIVRTSEKIAYYKTKKAVRAHKPVFNALRLFLQSEGKRKLTIITGNHDFELMYKTVQEYLIEILGSPEKIQFIDQRDNYMIEGNIAIKHGHQYEPANYLSWKDTFIDDHKGRRILRYPWGSVYLLKVLYPLKKDRNFIDKVYPVKRFLLYGIFFDTFFTIKLIIRSLIVFLIDRMWNLIRFQGLITTLRILRQEINLLGSLDSYAKRFLKKNVDVKAIIMGHTHSPRKVFAKGGKLYLNTGSWVNYISLEIQTLGSHNNLTYAKIVYNKDDTFELDLFEWHGSLHPYRHFTV